MDGRDLHVGGRDWGVLPPTAPLTIATQTLAGMAYAWKLRVEDMDLVIWATDEGVPLAMEMNGAAQVRFEFHFTIDANGNLTSYHNTFDRICD